MLRVLGSYQVRMVSFRKLSSVFRLGLLITVGVLLLAIWKFSHSNNAVAEDDGVAMRFTGRVLIDSQQKGGEGGPTRFIAVRSSSDQRMEIVRIPQLFTEGNDAVGKWAKVAGRVRYVEEESNWYVYFHLRRLHGHVGTLLFPWQKPERLRYVEPVELSLSN